MQEHCLEWKYCIHLKKVHSGWFFGTQYDMKGTYVEADNIGI